MRNSLIRERCDVKHDCTLRKKYIPHTGEVLGEECEEKSRITNKKITSNTNFKFGINIVFFNIDTMWKK